MLDDFHGVGKEECGMCFGAQWDGLREENGSRQATLLLSGLCVGHGGLFLEKAMPELWLPLALC